MTRMPVQLLKPVKLCGCWLTRGCRIVVDREQALALIRARLAMPVRQPNQGECRHG